MSEEHNHAALTTDQDVVAFRPPSQAGRFALFMRLSVGLGSAVGLAMAASAVAQILPVLYLVVAVPSPEPRSFQELMQDRYVQLMIEEEEEEEEIELPEAEEEEEEPEADAEPILAAEPEPEPERARAGTRARAGARARAGTG